MDVGSGSCCLHSHWKVCIHRLTTSSALLIHLNLGQWGAREARLWSCFTSVDILSLWERLKGEVGAEGLGERYVELLLWVWMFSLLRDRPNGKMWLLSFPSYPPLWIHVWWLWFLLGSFILLFYPNLIRQVRRLHLSHGIVWIWVCSPESDIFLGFSSL